MGRRSLSGKLAETHGLAGDRFPVTQEETRIAEDILASDLERLSLDEQEKLVFDIHGLPCVEGDSDKIERSLQALEKELELIPVEKKEAFNHALYMNPDYVQNTSFRRLFLDSAEYDPAFAADQMVQHFAIKKKLFGDGDVLGRTLLLSDLSNEDLGYLENSPFQLLPNRDAAGRVVLFFAPAVDFSDQSESMVRYRFVALCHSIHSVVSPLGL